MTYPVWCSSALRWLVMWPEILTGTNVRFSEVAGAADADRLIALESLIQEMDDKVNSIENQSDGLLLMGALSHLCIYDSLRCRKTNVSLLKRKKKRGKKRQRPTLRRLLSPWCPAGGVFYLHSDPCPGCSRERGLFLAWDGICVHVCTCVCVSLMAAFQLVRPNELIANGNGGLKCNWISGFCPLKGGRLAGKTTPRRPSRHYL